MTIPLAEFTQNDPRLTIDEATHTYWLGSHRLTSVTQVLGLTGLADFNAPWFTDAVQAKGTHLHAAIALDMEGDLDEDSLDEETLGGVAGWRKYLADSGAKLEFGEYPLCDPSLGVAGRLDYVMLKPDPRYPGRIVRELLDIKRGLYPSAAIQLAAYADMVLPLYPRPVILERAALVLPGDGTYHREPFKDHTDRATWHAAVRTLNWRRKHLDLREDLAA